MDNLSLDFIPQNIVITGPCIPYLVAPLRKKFSNSKIIGIQFSYDFQKYNSLWDYCFYVTKNTRILDFHEELFNYLGEENLCTSYFFSWKPSEKPFEQEYKITWESIKMALDKSMAIINTRNYFNKTWLYNSLRFYKNINSIAEISPISKPIIITASGPSLNQQIDFLKQNKKYFFLIALSSSLSPLLENSIIPDVILTTDGGYYASRHLKILETNPDFSNIPIILPPEARISSKILEKNPIIPLSFEDNFDSKILKELDINCIIGKRNGTVSGTGAELALTLTRESIYFMGLDLDSSLGYSHTQPNALELDNSINDFKLKSKEHRNVPNTFKNGSLEIYRNWFSTRNHNFYKQIFRIILKKDNLKQILNLTDIENSQIKHYEKKQETYITTQKHNLDKNKIFTYFTNIYNEVKKSTEINKKNEEWFKITSIIDFIKYKKQLNKTEIFKKIKDDTLNLLENILNYLKEPKNE